MRPLTRLTIALVVSMPFAGSAAADGALDNPTRSEREPPSMLAYGFAGLGTGALVGASGGYLAARNADWHWHRQEYRALGLGVGIGALAGLGLGLGLGGVDFGADAPGFGGIVLRDTLYGTGLGVLAGALSGTISAFAQHEGEHVLFGATIGAVAGAGVGMIIGFIEAPRAVRQRKEEDKERKLRQEKQHSIAPTVSATRDVQQQLVWTVGSAGRF